MNCFTKDKHSRGWEEFTCQKGLNCSNELIDLKDDTIITFTGSAFKIQRDHIPLLALDGTFTLFLPKVAGEFDNNTPALPGQSFEQIAALEFGDGRLIISAEAAMFSAQLTGLLSRPVGFNNPEAQDNCAFLLDLMRWLSGK